MDDYNLEMAIKSWRTRLHRTGKIEEGDLEEIETHLRDLTEDLISEGHSVREAFKLASGQVGDPSTIAFEHEKTSERLAWSQTRRFLPDLWIHYLKSGFRSFNRKINYNLVNFICLTFGLAGAVVITIYVTHEVSYDKQYTERPIYRIIHEETDFNGNIEIEASGPVKLGPVLPTEISTIKHSVRFWRAFRPTVLSGDNVFEESALLFTDTAAFKVFNFEFLLGSPETAFAQPNAILITEETAIRYFGEENPLDKTMNYSGYPGNDLSFTVTGVLKDLPANTHFKFDMLASFQLIKDWDTNWGSFKPCWTYVELENADQVGQTEKLLRSVAEKYLPSRPESDPNFAFKLEPVSNIHLQSEAEIAMKQKGSFELLIVLATTGFLILIMSCINFINTSLARAFSRMKEVGVRKAIGANKSQLVRQFLLETVMFVSLATLAALTLLVLLHGPFENFTGFPLSYNLVFIPGAIPILVGLFLLTVLIAGVYPALYMAGMNVLEAIQSKRYERNTDWFTHSSLQNSLLFVQLVLAGGLILSILVIKDQVDYIQSKDLGVDLNEVVAIPYSKEFDYFDSEIRKIPGIISFAHSQVLPVNTINYDGRDITTPGMEGGLPVRSSFVSTQFADTYSLRLITGRFFNESLLSDTSKFILNKKAVSRMGWTPEEAIGKTLTWSEAITGEVIGVIEDFHLESIHDEIAPTILLNDRSQLSYYNLFISVKYESSVRESVLESLEKKWKDTNPNRPYKLIYLQDSYLEFHKADYKLSDLIFVFMIIALFISISGLYGLSAFTIEKRNKEIGIRKVMGSSPWQVIVKLGKTYILLTSISLLITIPIVVKAMAFWLNGFAYFQPIRFSSMILGSLIIVGIAGLTILKESWKASTTNPIKYLKEE